MVTNLRHSSLLFTGDVVIFVASLWLTLLVRHFSLPDTELFYQHLGPFAILFAVWCVVFFVAGLYERPSAVYRRELPGLLLRTQLINIVIAIIFFYTIPYFDLAPKTNLFIYLAVSFFPLFLWRLYGFGFLSPRNRIRTALLGSGFELRELAEELENNPHSGLKVVMAADTDSLEPEKASELADHLRRIRTELVVLDPMNSSVRPFLHSLYHLLFDSLSFYNVNRLYQDVFGRVPISLLHYSWFLDNLSLISRRRLYNLTSRLLDVAVSVLLLITLAPILILAGAALKLTQGAVFFTQLRVGQGGRTFKLVKFRTMREPQYQGEDGARRITKLGRFLRASRLDELPQLWNVLKGDVSLVGPRPERPDFVEYYQKQIPFYGVRHLIKPGLSGWAQLYQKDPPKYYADIERSRRKLAYDLYYLVNRSLLLDLKIALKTLKVVLSRSGS